MNKKSHYLIHTKDSCPYCNKAKALLNYCQEDYELSYNKSLDWETYPCIYLIEGEESTLIGGFNELANHLMNKGTRR